MKRRRIAKLLIGSILIATVGVVSSHGVGDVCAKAKVRLSVTRRIHAFTDLWDTVTLKNVPAGARIKWRSSDSETVRIRKQTKNGIWYQTKRYGSAYITAVYKGKKYRCKVIVRADDPEETSVVSSTPAESSTPDTTLSPKPTTTPSGSAEKSDKEELYDEKLADFSERYITGSMSDYEKVDAICRYISTEYDYLEYQSDWFKMVRTGSGDCMASRIGVERLCKLLGIRAFGCDAYEDHGQTMVRIGDDIFMTVTGYDEPHPRSYDLYRMTEEQVQKKLAKYKYCAYYLGL